jgi:hypothetical protein
LEWSDVSTTGLCAMKIQLSRHHHHFIECVLFLPLYSWKISHMVLNNNHSLTHCNNYSMFKPKYLMNSKQSSRWAPVLHFQDQSNFVQTSKFFSFYSELHLYIKINSRISFRPVNSNFQIEDWKSINISSNKISLFPLVFGLFSVHFWIYGRKIYRIQ